MSLYKLVLFFLCIAGAQAGTFTNPMRPANSADPFVTCRDGQYYLVCTTTDTHVVVMAAKTLDGLKTAEAKSVFDVKEFFESPEIYFFDGHWYIYYTIPGKNNAVCVLESESTEAQGKYALKNVLMGGCWDANLLQMPDGKLYMLVSISGNGIGIQPMSNPYTLTGQRTELTTYTLPWEKQTSGFMEAPQALVHNGDIFILYTSGVCAKNNYFLGALKLTGKNPEDPSSWTKLDGPLFQGNEKLAFGGGDCTPFKTAGGDLWFCYGAWDKEGAVRSCRAQKLDFLPDGTPHFGKPIASGTPQPAPTGE